MVYCSEEGRAKLAGTGVPPVFTGVMFFLILGGRDRIVIRYSNLQFVAATRSAAIAVWII